MFGFWIFFSGLGWVGFRKFFRVWVRFGLDKKPQVGSGFWVPDTSLYSTRLFIFSPPNFYFIFDDFKYFCKKTYAANATVCSLYFDSKIQQIDEEKSSSSCIQLISPSSYIGLPDFWFLVSPLIQQFVLEIGSPN